jgi:hypothetical protein
MDSGEFDHEFELVPTSVYAPATHEAVVVDILKEMTSPKVRQPLLCVTFKQPMKEYRRLQAVSERWHLKYTHVLRFFVSMAVAVLESPSGDLLDLLEKNRDLEIEKDRQRKEADERRLSKHAAALGA